MDGSTLRSRGTSRLGFMVTLGMVPAGQQPVRLRELKPGLGAPQLSHPEVPGQGLPAEVPSQLLRLLKPTTQERQAIVAPGRVRRWASRPPRGPVAGSGYRQGRLETEVLTPVLQCSLAPGGRDASQPDQPVRWCGTPPLPLPCLLPGPGICLAEGAVHRTPTRLGLAPKGGQGWAGWRGVGWGGRGRRWGRGGRAD